MRKKAVSDKIVAATHESEKIENAKLKKLKKESRVQSFKKTMAKRDGAATEKIVAKTWKEGQVIAFNKVSLKFTKEFFALFEISFAISSGEKVAIVGEDECGKTSILRILAGLEFPFSGGAYIFSQKITRNLFKKENGVSLGYVPEKPLAHFGKTVLQNIVIAKRLREKKSETDRDVAQGILTEFSLQNVAGEKVKNVLSNFDLQKLALARLSVRKLDIVVIDDIFKNFSADETKEFFSLLQKILSKRTVVVFATGSEEVANQFASRKIHMDNGTLSTDEEIIS